MSSTIKFPNTNLSWFVSGNRLGIVTNSTGRWLAIDKTVSAGILVHYFGEPDPIPFDQPEQYPDLPPALHSALIDYIKGKLFLDRAAKAAALPETAAVYLSLAREHMRIWKMMVNRRLPSLTAKVSGPHYMVPLSINDR